MPAIATPSEVLSFWFGGSIPADLLKRWFQKDAALDEEIRQRFGATVEKAARGELDLWFESSAEYTIALIVLLDQFPRNLYRNSAKAFASDAQARAISLKAQERGDEMSLNLWYRYALYLPLMHAEDRAVQRQSVQAYARLLEDAETIAEPKETLDAFRGALDYAERHAAIVERFGRFPHRNALMSRASTQEEIDFLQCPNSSF